MSGIRDTATVTLNVNGAQAKQMMSELQQKIADTKKHIADLKAKAADPKEIERARKQLKNYQKQFDEMRSSVESVNDALTDLSATPRQLEKALRTLNRQLKDMTPGSDVWDSHVEKINLLKARLEDIRDEMGEQQSLWSKFKEWSMSAWPAIDLLQQWGSSVVDVARSSVDAFAEMEQEMANVRKFTGMTGEQIADLNAEFKKIDTRTSREDLNKLAQEAGRLGKTSPEDIMGFVRAADKINVALDDLGQGATLTLSKLTGIFGDEKRLGTEKALLSVGSVINELSQNCAASAPYIAEFASRMGGVGAQAGMTIQQIMGFAAVLDSNEQKVEASSTALSQVIVRMMQDPAKYARVAGLEVQSFADLLRKDANSALLLFLETLQKAGGMDVLSPMFKDMGENGSRAIAALSTLATHIGEVKAQQEVANEAFKEATSIDKEFNVQNNTIQAGLDKAKKAAQEIRVELGERLQPVMSHLITTTSMIMRAMLTVINFLSDHKAAVLTVVASIAAYNIAINLAAIRTAFLAVQMKALGIAIAAQRTIVLGATAVWSLLTGNITKATRAFRLLSAAIKADPVGLAVAAATALIGAMAALARRMRENRIEAQKQREELAKLSKAATDVSGKMSDSAAREVAALKNLYQAAVSEANSKEQRIKAAKDLIALYPDQFKNFTAEQISLGKAKKAYDDLTRSIIDNAKAKAAAELVLENEKKILQLEQELNNHRADYKKAETKIKDIAADNKASDGQTFTNMYQSGVGGHVRKSDADARRERNEAAKNMRQAKTEIYTLQKAVDSLTESHKKNGEFQKALMPEVTPDTGIQPGGPSVSGGSGSNADRFAAEKEWKDKQEALARISYAKGESDYEQYTTKMSQIQVDFNQKLLDRDDLSGTERLKIEADYWEAVNKDTQAQHARFVAIENESYENSVQNLNEQYAKKLEAGNMSAEQRQAAEKAHQEALELAELEHLRRLTVVTEQGSDERNKAERQYLDARLKAAQRHQQEYERSQKEHEKKLASIKDKYFGMNDGEKKEAYDKDLAALTEVYNAELRAAGNNADEKLRIEKAFQDAKLALQEQYDQESAEKTKNSMQKAIADSVEWLNGDGGKAVTGTLDTLVSGMSSIFSGLSSLMQAELDIQTAAINNRYDKEVEAAEGNSYRIKKIEKQREADLAKAKKEANRKMFAMQIIQAVAQTAQNALNAYGSAAAVPVVGYILAPIAAAMAVAAGAIQIASIKKQQQASEAQGYSKGGFTKPGRVDEPAGIVHAGEWVASQKLLKDPVARPMIEALDYAQHTNTVGTLRPADVSRSIRANDSLVRMAESDGSSALVVAAVAQNAQVVDALNTRLKEPLVAVVTMAGDHGVVKAQDEYDQYMRNKKPKSSH